MAGPLRTRRDRTGKPAAGCGIASSMSQEPPRTADDRTTIRPAPLRRPPDEHSSSPVEPTVLAGIPADGGWSQSTVIAGAASVPLAATSLADVFAAPDARAGSSGPLMAAAAHVLLPLARLQVEQPGGVHASVLHERFRAALENFDGAAATAGLPPGDARLARRSLAAAVDDVVGHLPSVDPAAWRKMGSADGTGWQERGAYTFFEDLNGLLAEPRQRTELLELLHACLALGFQGQYRGRPGAESELAGIRADIYRFLRHLRPSPVGPDGRSGVLRQTDRRRARFRLIAVGGMLVLVGLALGGMRLVLTRDGDALEAELLSLVPSGAVTLGGVPPAVASAPTAPAAAASSPRDAGLLLERFRTALAEEIAAGEVTVTSSAGELAIEINNARLFSAGSADLKESFAPLTERFGGLLRTAGRPVRVIGYTDNVKPRRSSPFASNQALSAARAEAVAKALAQSLGDRIGLSFEGRGEADPIADNGTAEGRARNRRVVIVLSGEAAQ